MAELMKSEPAPLGLNKTHSVALYNLQAKLKESAIQILATAGFQVCGIPSKLNKPTGKVIIVAAEHTKQFDE